MSLTLLTWPDYISPLTLSQFEREYQVSVTLEVVPSAVELVSRMRESDGEVLDVLVPPDYAVRELTAENLLLPLDHSRLPNINNLAPRFRMGRSHDAESRFSLAKDWGTTGFMYRTDQIRENLVSWVDFWRAAGSVSGRVSVLDSPGEVIGAALKMRGRSYNASDPAALAQARDDLLALKPHLLAFETNYRSLLASGEVALALGWNGDASALRAQGVPIVYVVPQEGSQFWEDDWAVAARSAHPELAHDFLNFVLRPEIAAQEALYTRYATPNEAALALLESSIRDDRSTYPPDSVLELLEPGMPLSPAEVSRRDALWKEVRN